MIVIDRHRAPAVAKAARTAKIGLALFCFKDRGSAHIQHRAVACPDIGKDRLAVAIGIDGKEGIVDKATGGKHGGSKRAARKRRRDPRCLLPLNGAAKDGVGIGKLGIGRTVGREAHKPRLTVVEGGIREQTERIMKNLGAILTEAGLDFSAVVKTTCFLADMGDFAAFNEVYGAAFGDHKPARSCVAVKTLPKGVLAEVEVIAEIK